MVTTPEEREAGRVRSGKSGQQKFPQPKRQQNPYPWMSLPEALVRLELEHRQIKFSWRYFGNQTALITKSLIPDFAPEFTLPDQHIVILVVGNYFGVLPGVLDRNALAAATLEADGWKCVFLYEDELLRSANLAIDKQLPELINVTQHGAELPNPYGQPDLGAKRRALLAHHVLGHRKPDPTRSLKQEDTSDDSSNSANPRTRSGVGGRDIRRRHSSGALRTIRSRTRAR